MRCVLARPARPARPARLARVARLGPAAVLTAAAAFGATAGSAPAGANAVSGNAVAAVWKERHLDFVYQGRTARFSCGGLRDKVRAMLLDLGARRDVKIVAIGCVGEDRLRVDSSQPTLSIVFSAPALPDSTARPLGVGDLEATEARFAAFMITSDAFRNMGVGDCELVQEFARQILPRLVTRDVRQDISCGPPQEGASHFWVRGDVLKALPRVEPAGGRSGGGHPPGGESLPVP